MKSYGCQHGCSPSIAATVLELLPQLSTRLDIALEYKASPSAIGSVPSKLVAISQIQI